MPRGSRHFLLYRRSLHLIPTVMPTVYAAKDSHCHESHAATDHASPIWVKCIAVLKQIFSVGPPSRLPRPSMICRLLFQRKPPANNSRGGVDHIANASRLAAILAAPQRLFNIGR